MRAALMLALALLANCDRDQSPPRQPASRSVTLRINAWTGYVEPYAKEFRQRARDTMAVDVELVWTPAAGLERFREVLRSGEADLVSPANDLLAPLVREGLIRPIDRGAVGSFSQINPLIQKTRYFEIDGETWAVPFVFGPYGIAYDRDVMSPPRSYHVLWAPAYRGRVSISGAYETANIYMAALTLRFPSKDLFNLRDEQLAQIEQKLTELHGQIRAYSEANLDADLHDAVDVGLDCGVGVHEINRRRNGNWGFTIPTEGATAWVDNWAVSAQIDPHKLDVAHAFIDFMVSPRMQAEVARQTTYGPVNIYATRYLSRREKAAYHVTDPDYLRRLILRQPLAPEVLEKYQALWQRVRNPATRPAGQEERNS